MIPIKIEQAINEQINAEMWSANLYLSMAAHFNSEGLSGLGNWMKIQHKEETDHALKFFEYINSRGGSVEIKAIEAVPTKWESPLAIFEETLKHECKVTALINNLMEIAILEKDHATQSMLKWFIDEQVEEEETAQEIIDHLRMIKDNGYGLFMLDKELGSRTYTPLNSNSEA